MKLSDFALPSRTLLINRLSREKEMWEQQKKIEDYFVSRGRKTNEFLFGESVGHYDKFSLFYESVMKDGEMEAAFQIWTGEDIYMENTDKLNAPQTGFQVNFLIEIRKLNNN